MCIGIVEIWFGIANRQSWSIFDRVICPHMSVFSGKFHQFLTVICLPHDNGGVLWFHAFFYYVFVFVKGMFSSVVSGLIMIMETSGLIEYSLHKQQMTAEPCMK